MMDISVTDILRIGIADGLIWFPIVLGVGLLYTYFRELDVSVDGNVVLSAIVSAFVWRATESYSLSIAAGAITGVAGSLLVAGIQVVFRVGSLMAGIVFTLAAHALSVILIGESLVLPDTSLFGGFGSVQSWQVVFVVGLIAMTILAYNSRFGLAVRKLGSGCQVNTVYSSGILRCSAYGLSGLLYGLGGSLYAHSQGMAKSGGSFEFLLVSLCAYLCVARLADAATFGFRLLRREGSSGVSAVSSRVHLIGSFILSPGTLALVGAIAFETLLFFTISVSPNPMAWKLLFSVLLLFALARPSARAFAFLMRWGRPIAHEALCVEDLCVHYDIGSERRVVFDGATAEFAQGINLIRGPNGTGKSTLLKTIYGLVAPTSGQVRCNGQNLVHVAPHRRPCYILLQNPMDTLGIPNNRTGGRQDAGLTVAENLFEAWRAASPIRLATHPEVVLKPLCAKLAAMGVSPIRPVDDPFWMKPVASLSGGEAHCVAAYCAILSDAALLLADEPTTGLDEENFLKLTALLKAIGKERIVLLTSHDTRVSPLADRSFVVGGGQIRLNGEYEGTR